MIRGFVAADRLPVIELLRSTGNFTAVEIGIAAELIDTILDQPAQQDYYAFVDAAGPDVTGFLLLGQTPATAGTWDMYWIAVHPNHHGSGVATALDCFAEAFVQSRGGYWILAETSSQESYARTRAFYRKRNYQVVARIPDYYRYNDDLIVFGKRLKPDGGAIEQ